VRKLGKTRLRIDDVGAADNGVYSCSARNVAGSVDSDDNFVLNVYGTNYKATSHSLCRFSANC